MRLGERDTSVVKARAELQSSFSTISVLQRRISAKAANSSDNLIPSTVEMVGNNVF